MSPVFAVVAALGLLIAPLANAHSWIEQMSLIGPNGSFVANGYPRGYVARQDPSFDGNSDMWMLPGATTGRHFINDQDLLCHTSQRNPTQSPNYPRLGVAPGSYLAMKYLENGHVATPDNQPGKEAKGGTVFVFGTTQPNPAQTLSGVLEWTADGSGGDKQGKLLQAQNFDDDRCYQMNLTSPIVQARIKQFPNPKPGQTGSTNELWCESNAMIPSDAPVGKPYTLYWIWQWPTMPGKDSTYPDGKDEYYTTCMDVDVEAQAPETGFYTHTLQQQDPMPSAVSDYKSRTALQPTPWPKGVQQAGSGSPAAQVTPGAHAVQAAPGTSPAASGATTSAAAVAQPAGNIISMDGDQAVAGPAQPAPQATTPAAATMSGSMVVPLALNQFTPPASSAVASTPAVATASSPAVVAAPTPSAAVSATAAPTSSAPAVASSTPTAAPGGMQILTVPAGSPVFMFNSAGQVVTLAKRVAPPSSVEAAAVTVVKREPAFHIAPRHRIAHAHHAGAARGRWSYQR